MATDGKSDTSWSSDPQDVSPWLALDLGAPCTIERMELEGHFLSGDRIVASHTVDFAQTETLATYQGKPGPALEILSATYGAGANRSDLTEKLRQAASAGSLRVTASNALAGGDPAPNHAKELRVEYTLGGVQSTKVVEEDEALTLGDAAPWQIDFSARPKFRHLRLERTTDRKALHVAEWRVFGSF
jgi:hypothetical protein